METQALSPGGRLGPKGGSVPRRTQRAIGASPAGHRVRPREAWPQSHARCHLGSSVKMGCVSAHIAAERPAINTVPAIHLPGLGGQSSL